MDTELMLDVSQAHEFKLACRRSGLTNADIKRMCEGDLLAKLLPVVRGLGEVVITKHVIDLAADPLLPNSWEVEKHIKGGQFEINPTKIALHLDEEQQNGGSIGGNKLRNKLKGKPVFNANLLDFYLDHPHLIPEEWMGKAIFFWGTIYRRSNGDLYVRCLFLDGNGCDWRSRWLGSDFDGSGPAAVFVSN